MNWYKTCKATERELGMKRDFAGITVHVENPAGTVRMGIDPDGNEWRIEMKYDYGFIYSAKGADGEGLDVYLGPDQEAKTAYIVHQNDPSSGKYDEDKVMLGFASAAEAKKAYLDHYDSKDFFGSMSEISFAEFKNLVTGADRRKINWKKKGDKV